MGGKAEVGGETEGEEEREDKGGEREGNNDTTESTRANRSIGQSRRMRRGRSGARIRGPPTVWPRAVEGPPDFAH